MPSTFARGTHFGLRTSMRIERALDALRSIALKVLWHLQSGRPGKAYYVLPDHQLRDLGLRRDSFAADRHLDR